MAAKSSALTLDTYLSWAWSPWRVAQVEKQEQSGLILPGDYKWNVKPNEEPDPCLVHFAGLTPEGLERNWIWLFPDEREARALRLLPQYTEGEQLNLIEATLPITPKNEPEHVYLQVVPQGWLKDLPLVELNITEVWYGFDYKVYKWDRVLEATCQRFSTEEFLDALKRAA